MTTRSAVPKAEPGSVPWVPALTSDDFVWHVPGHFNIGIACAEVHDPAAAAIIVDRPGAPAEVTTFGRLTDRARRLITYLREQGVSAGDRVAVMCAQSAETAVAHIAIYRMGAIAVPLSVKFGPEAALFRMADSGARAALFDADCYDRLSIELAGLADLTSVLVTGDIAERHGGGEQFTVASFGVIDTRPAAVDPPNTEPDDPALLIYTSGTTGQPKGALHGHRVVLGHLPGVRRSQDGFPREDDVFWTPADWAWAGGLLDVLLPSLYYGRPVVASAARPTPEGVERILREHRVTCSFLPPTILKMMRASTVDYTTTRLRSACSGGEALGESVAVWARDSLGISVNEIYGQTEMNLVVGTCHAEFETPAGSMGRPTPGFDLELRDRFGDVVPQGETGEICVRLPSPNAFLRYWNAPDKTAEKTADGVIHTGDLARVDQDGNYWFDGRDDDLISSAGYRVGPGEIEDQILRHPAVQMVAVIGVPDEMRGEAIVAYVVPSDPDTADDELARDIQVFVKERLAFYQYPRQVVFLDALPTTPTGKIRRAQLRSQHR